MRSIPPAGSVPEDDAWQVWHAQLAPEQLDFCTEALVAAGFTSFAVSAHADEAASHLELYVQGGGVPTAVRAVCDELGVRLAAQASLGADEILAMSGAGPRELCPGVTVVDERGQWDGVGEVVVVPPDPAFGDGRHPSTRLAARLLGNIDCGGRTVLDLGCGTGVLGVLAALRGAASAHFLDIDPAAVRAARATAQANDLVGQFAVADLLGGFAGQVDVLIANLYADLVVDCAADSARVVPNGDLIVSGIASARWPAICALMCEHGWRLVEHCEEAWWSAAHLRR